jgi:hypothetical protein
LNPAPAVVVKVTGTEPPVPTLALAALSAKVQLGFATDKVID